MLWEVSEVQNAERGFKFCSPGLFGYRLAELQHLLDAMDTIGTLLSRKDTNAKPDSALPS